MLTIDPCRECGRPCSGEDEHICSDCFVPESPTVGWMRARLLRRHGVSTAGMSDAVVKREMARREPANNFRDGDTSTRNTVGR